MPFAVTQRERDHRDPPIRQSPPQPFPCFAPPLPFSLSNQSQVEEELLPEFRRTSASIAVCVNQLRNKSSAEQHTYQVWSLCKIIQFIFICYWILRIYGHNSPIYDEYQTQSAKGLTHLRKQAHQDDSNDSTPQPICEFQVIFPLLRIRMNQHKPYFPVKGSQLETPI